MSEAWRVILVNGLVAVVVAVSVIVVVSVVVDVGVLVVVASAHVARIIVGITVWIVAVLVAGVDCHCECGRRDQPIVITVPPLL